MEADAISYLHERPGVSKTIVTTANKATAEGWPALMSQHLTAGGTLTVKLATGRCRMRAR